MTRGAFDRRYRMMGASVAQYRLSRRSWTIATRTAVARWLPTVVKARAQGRQKIGRSPRQSPGPSTWGSPAAPARHASCWADAKAFR